MPSPVPTADIEQLQRLAARLRGKVVEMSGASGAAHLASALSCIDILVAAYWGPLRIDPADPANPLRDRFILSKGHAASALYAVLAERGFFPKAELDHFAKFGSRLAEQPAPGCAPGIELATGSLGHGLPVGTGHALASRIQNQSYEVLVCMSDGECNEGSVWEAAMFAAARGLGNLTVVIDYNLWQATGRSNEIMALAPLKDKWAAFGWHTHEVNGHDYGELGHALSREERPEGKPTAIIAHTVKGRGVSFMEDDNNWHYRIPTPAEVAAAHKELGLP
jgi:transketolase